MAITPTALRSEILSDPAGVGYAGFVATGSTQRIANLLNARTGPGTFTVKRKVLVEDIERYLHQQALYTDLEDAADNQNLSAPARKAARSVMALCRASRLRDVDTTKPPFQIGLDALQAAGVITAGHKAAVLSLADYTASRAEVLAGEEGYRVSSTDVAVALYQTS